MAKLSKKSVAIHVYVQQADRMIAKRTFETKKREISHGTVEIQAERDCTKSFLSRLK